MTTNLAPTTSVSLKQAIRDTWIIVKRNAMRNIRIPELVLFATVQPVMFLLLFNYVFGGSIGESLGDAFGGKYINFLLPGMLVQTALFSSIQTAIGLTEDLGAGVIDRFRSLPIARSAVLAGRTLADMFRTFVVMTLLLAVGFLVGFDAPGGVLRTLAGLCLCALFGFAMSWVMALVGLLVKTPEAANSAGFLPLFPLMFVSSIFVPPESLPSWMVGFANNQPVTVLSETLRGLILGDEFMATQSRSLSGLVLYSLLWIGAIIAVFAPLAVRKYRRTVA